MDSYEQTLTFKTRISFRALLFRETPRLSPLATPWSLVKEDLPSRKCPGSRCHSAQGLFGKEKSKKTAKNQGLKMSWLLGLGDPQSRELGAETERL